MYNMFIIYYLYMYIYFEINFRQLFMSFTIKSKVGQVNKKN